MRPTDRAPGSSPALEEKAFRKSPLAYARGSYSKSSFRQVGCKTSDHAKQIAQAFSGRLALAPVVDKTGLTGAYDFALYLAPARYFEDFEADLEATVQKELGLKLEKAEVQIDVLVIDHIERVPTAN